MAADRPITLNLSQLFDLFDESIARIPQEHRGPALAGFCMTLQTDYGVTKAEIDECMRMLVFKEDFMNGFVDADGVVRRKEIVATRMVPVSQPEQMGENGLMWRDVRR
jgi:hypothetical protein